MLSRAPAPKAGAYSGFATPASPPILSLRSPTNLLVTSLPLSSSWRKGTQVRSAEEFEAVQRLTATGMNDCAVDRCRVAIDTVMPGQHASVTRLHEFVGPTHDARIIARE
jgi:hypothetical protein